MRFHFPFRIPHFAFRTLDRYAVGEWLRVFLITLLGFPILVLVIDLTDKLDQYLGRGIKPAAVALSYVFYFPELMFLILPVAVLFATVFTVGALGRHSLRHRVLDADGTLRGAGGRARARGRKGKSSERERSEKNAT